MARGAAEVGRALGACIFGRKLARVEEAKSVYPRLLASDCRSFCAGTLASIIFVGIYKTELRERDVGGTSLGPGTCRLMPSEAHLLAAGPSVAMAIAGLDVISSHSLSYTLAAAIEENRALLAAIRGRGSQAASHGCQSPLLDIRFDEDEAHLTKIHMHLAGAVGADRWKEVVRLEAVRDIVQLLTVAREENRPCARPISDANDVSLNVCGAVGSGCEGLVVSAGSVRHVCK